MLSLYSGESLSRSIEFRIQLNKMKLQVRSRKFCYFRLQFRSNCSNYVYSHFPRLTSHSNAPFPGDTLNRKTHNETWRIKELQVSWFHIQDPWREFYQESFLLYSWSVLIMFFLIRGRPELLLYLKTILYMLKIFSFS